MNRPGNSRAYPFKQGVEIAIGGEADAGLERRPDEFVVARSFQALEDVVPHFH